MRSWTPVLLVAQWLWVPQAPFSAQENNPVRTFADIFASVLRGENPDGGDWSGPGKYLEGASEGSAPPTASELPVDRYRLLIVPGFLSACTSTARLSAPAFNLAEEHLRKSHQMDVTLLQVPNDSCENNGRFIAKYLRDHAAGKRFIVVGHSKGAPDLQAALQDSAAASHVAAFVSVAGAVHGSPIAELPDGIKLLGNIDIELGCVGHLGPALKSLRREERQAFLDSHSAAKIPSYSIVAASGFTNTSKGLLASWGLLGAGLLGKEDGLLMAADSVLPNSKFLGTVRADHMALAHDFQHTAAAGLFNKGDFPRAALLEALVRFVMADLESAGRLQ